MPEPTNKDLIELAVKRAIAEEVETYRKTMEGYSGNLEKAAENHAKHLQRLTMFLVGAFTILVGAAVYFYTFFLGKSVDETKAQVSQSVTNIVPNIVPDLVRQKVRELGIVTQANEAMFDSIQTRRAQLEEDAGKKMALTSSNLQSTTIDKLNAAALAAQSSLSGMTAMESTIRTIQIEFHHSKRLIKSRAPLSAAFKLMLFKFTHTPSFIMRIMHRALIMELATERCGHANLLPGLQQQRSKTWLAYL